VNDQTGDDAALVPPEAQLVAPEPVKPVPPERAVGRVTIKADERSALDAQVAQATRELVELPLDGDEFKTRVNAISAMGDAEIARSASVSNRLLEKPTRAMQSGIFDSKSGVSKGLLDLRRTIETLDPSRQGDLFSPKRILGVLPFGNKVKDYFRGYESSQTHLNAIIESLYRSKDELLRDNASIEQEKANMWSLMQKLEQYAYLAKSVAEAVQAQIARVEQIDPDRARILREEVLFYARQKQQDIATQMAVNVQGYMALDLIKKNNVELAKGVDRATTTTVSALRTAIVTAQALTSQKLVLDQIGALNTTTSNLIESTSKMLKDNSTRVFEQASSASIDMDKLKAAFANVQAAIDGVSTYRVKALSSMEQTVTSLNDEVSKARSYLDKQRGSIVSQSIDELAPAPPGAGVARIV